MSRVAVSRRRSEAWRGKNGPTRPGRRSGRGPGVTFAVLLAASACAGYSVDAMREELIGLSGRSLRGCIGVPVDVAVEDDREYLTYRWLEEPEQDPFTRRDRFPGDLGVPPEIGSRDRRAEALDPELARQRTGAKLPPPRGVEYCELVFEIREGRVRGVEVDGRLASGLRDDLRCIRKARSCVPASEGR